MIRLDLDSIGMILDLSCMNCDCQLIDHISKLYRKVDLAIFLEQSWASNTYEKYIQLQDTKFVHIQLVKKIINTSFVNRVGGSSNSVVDDNEGRIIYNGGG